LPPHSNSNPPREKNKNGEGAKGEGGTPRLCEALGGMVRVTTESERTIQSEATTHAERAISHQSDYCENMFELFLTNTANLDTLRNFWNRGARFARCMENRRGGQRIFSEWQKARFARRWGFHDEYIIQNKVLRADGRQFQSD